MGPIPHPAVVWMRQPTYIQPNRILSDRARHASATGSISRFHFPHPTILCTDKRAAGECVDSLHYFATGTKSRRTGDSGPLY